jgi:glycosyltransferase involved in cell wall biosynthesis
MRKVLLLFGSRRLNRRQGRFFEWLVRSGYQVSLFALPRRSWIISALEADTRDLDVRRCTITTKGTRGMFIPNMVICCNWSMLPLAIGLKLVFGSKVMYDEDDYPEIMFKSIGNWSQRHVTRVMARLFKKLFVPLCDLVTCINLKDNLCRKDLTKYNPKVIELDNFPSRFWRPDGPETNGAWQGLKFVYLGNITEQKGCRTCGEAFVKATEESLAFRGAELHYFGSWGDPELVDWLRIQDGISVHMDVSSEQIRTFLRQGPCVGLLPYRDLPYYAHIGTNSLKFYEYLAMGFPVISTRVGDLERFITKHDVGYLVGSPLSCEGLTELFVRISENSDELKDKRRNALAMMSQDSMRWEAAWEKILRTGFFNENGR